MNNQIFSTSKKKNVTYFVQFRVTKSHMLDKIVQLVGSVSALITHFGIRKGQHNVSQFVHKMPANLQNINQIRRKGLSSLIIFKTYMISVLAFSEFSIADGALITNVHFLRLGGKKVTFAFDKILVPKEMVENAMN